MNICKRTLFIFFLFVSCLLNAQQIKKVLFIGNSYTYVNNLPQLIADIAHANGDSLWWDSSTPGGYTFQLHTVNATTTAKINADHWNVVVLQEQSQLPSFPPTQVQTQCFPYADTLNRYIKTNDFCTTTMFFMTWGRKNGDYDNCGSYPPVCTYLGMQQRLRESYLQMGQMFDAEVSPVGMAWKAVRDSFPTIELYQGDESHPSMNGSYLAASTFYAAIFHKADTSSYVPVGVDPTDAGHMRQIAINTVFDSLVLWNIDTTTVHANFTYLDLGSGQYQFTNASVNADTYFWTFGDGNTSTVQNPSHTYNSSGLYQIMLIAQKGCQMDTIIYSVNIIVGIHENNFTSFSIYPVPASDYIMLINSTLSKNTTLEILNSIGARVSVLNLQPNEKIDVSGLPNGIYFARLMNDGKTSAIKFVISR